MAVRRWTRSASAWRCARTDRDGRPGRGPGWTPRWSAPGTRVAGSRAPTGRRAVPGVVDVGRVGVVDDLRRRHMVEEATPLVEGDDEHRVVQVPRAGQG